MRPAEARGTGGAVRAQGGEALVLGVHFAKRYHPAHLVEAAVEDAGGTPDPLLRACRAAVRKILEELPRELSSERIQTAEVRLDALQDRDPEESAKQIVRALKGPEGPGGEPSIYRF